MAKTSGCVPRVNKHLLWDNRKCNKTLATYDLVKLTSCLKGKMNNLTKTRNYKKQKREGRDRYIDIYLQQTIYEKY